MKNNLLNVELISNKKLDKSDLEVIKERMESKEDFILLYSFFIEVMELNFSGYMEIYLEDVEIEQDLQESISKMIYDLDEIVPDGLSNDSKIEWISQHHISNVWYKDNNIWLEKTSGARERDFFDDNWEEDYDKTYGCDDFGEEFDDDNW